MKHSSIEWLAAAFRRSTQQPAANGLRQENGKRLDKLTTRLAAGPIELDLTSISPNLYADDWIPAADTDSTTNGQGCLFEPDCMMRIHGPERPPAPEKMD